MTTIATIITDMGMGMATGVTNTTTISIATVMTNIVTNINIKDMDMAIMVSEFHSGCN